jgi:hypothetical protein
MNTDQFKLEDNIEVEGITADFIWYEAAVLRKDMQMWALRFEKLVKVMEARHKEHDDLFREIMNQNRDLKFKLKEKDGE